jgi:uncharacterized membrane protein YhaH (DUF805 family)
MEKINWKQKLTSRKFWAFIAAVILVIAIFIFGDYMTQIQVGLIEKVVYIIIAYILGESIVDVARIVKNADKNGNGTIELDELVDAISTEVMNIISDRQSADDATKEGDGDK